MNISQLLCSPPPSQASSPGRSSNGAPHAPVSDHHHYDSRSSQGSPTPSNPDTQYKVISTQYRCGNCRQRGHNRKTCPPARDPQSRRLHPPGPEPEAVVDCAENQDITALPAAWVLPRSDESQLLPFVKT
ncbi:hypothetical protein MVEN_01030200 [Mycena venus]|uniref:CCHC-type domain-containing protein n=1 Tax=Mycena venus TaxID=2733690 RepID=A0A8H6YD35_9AGAR|nr:hypothetical protein MVEN_01030200 [Mycena venus]